MFKWISLLTVWIFFSQSALADFELRAHYANWGGKPTTFNSEMSATNSGFPSVAAPNVMGADLFYVLPFIHLLVGLRYETFTVKSSGDVVVSGVTFNTTNKVTGSRTSMVGGYRLINWPVGYVGVLAQYSLSQSLNYDFDLKSGPADTMYHYKGKLDPSYAVGVEAGFKLNMFILGAEMGYTMMKAKSFTDQNGGHLQDGAGGDIGMDFSGSYMRAVLGLSF